MVRRSPFSNALSEKAFLILFNGIIAGFVSTQPAFKPGNNYRYEYLTRVATGIPETSSQYTGMQITGIMNVQVISPNTLVLSGESHKAVEWNSELKGDWRDGEIQNETPLEIKEEFAKYLDSPMEITMERGVVKSIKVDESLPTWAINIKKVSGTFRFQIRNDIRVTGSVGSSLPPFYGHNWS